MTETTSSQDHATSELPTRPANERTSVAEQDTDSPTIIPLAQHSREIFKVIKKLGTLGIDNALPSLPKFVVVGEQSAGKSSLIEALCDIRLPRSEGTCTRCPFEITTNMSDGPWECRISIQTSYAHDSRVRAGKNDEKFDRWRRQEVSTREFAIVHDKDKLEDLLRRAQLALLNPNQDISVYLNKSFDPIRKAEDRMVGFSPNLICLQISSPELPEMLLYDLPGVINVHRDQQYLVKLIEALAKSYLEDDKTLVLFARAANTDPDTTTTARFIQDCEAEARCTGVITKADLMTHSAESLTTLEDTLRGSLYPMQGGYFVTRQLHHEELRQIPYARAREIEREFFDQKPWNDSLQEWQHRFGIPNLQVAISEKLRDHINANLPAIRDRVEKRLAEVKEKLEGFPAPAGDPTLTVMNEISRVKDVIKGKISPDTYEREFRGPYREIFKDLATRLKNCGPKAVLSTPGYVKPSIFLPSDEDEPDGTPTPSKGRKLNGGGKVHDSPNQNRATPGKPRKAPSSQKKPHQEQPTGAQMDFHLDMIKKMCDESPGADLGSGASQKILARLIAKTQVKWPDLVRAALQSISDVFMNTLQEALALALARRRATPLFQEANNSLQNLFVTLRNEQAGRVQDYIECELHRPISYSSQFKDRRDAEKERLLTERAQQRVQEYFETLEGDGQKVPKHAEQTAKAKDLEWMQRNLVPDTYQMEVEALATPLAYYDSVSPQIVDTLAKGVERNVIFAFENHLTKVLLHDLKLNDPRECLRLLADEPQREVERQNLVTEKEKLLAALAELDGLSGDIA